MAVPNPQRELDRLHKQLCDGLPRCTVIHGTADFFRSEAVDMVVAAVPESTDLRRIDGDKETDGHEIDDLRGGTLFGGGTVVVVRRGEGWLKSHGEALLRAIDKIRPGSALVLEIKKLDKRTKVAKAVVKSGESFEFRDLYTEPYDRSRSPLDAEIVGWLVQRSRTLECPLAPDAAFLVVSTVGTRPGELLAELARIAERAGKTRRPLSAESLRGHLTCSFESTPFEFADAVLVGDRRRASRSLSAMFARGAASKDGARIDRGGLFPFITSWLHQSLAQLHEARLLLDAGVPLAQVPGRVGVRVFADRFTDHLRRNQEPRLRRALLLLNDCQRELRSSGEDPEYLLLRFLARLFATSEAA